MTETYYFLHIPKTAGSTLCFSVLPELFNLAETCPAHDYPEILSIPPAELSRFRLFRGHFYYFFARFLSAKPRYLTFLRDPVERTLSLYDHICRDTRHFQHHAMCSLKNGLRDAVRSPELLPPNFQVTALASDLDPVRTLALSRAAHPENLDEYSVVYSEMTKRIPTRDDLAVARQRLEEMEFVGIVERFDESIELLCSTFGWKVPAFESMNIAPVRTRRDGIASDVLAALMQTHALDFELYEFAKSLFSRRVSRKQFRRPCR